MKLKVPYYPQKKPYSCGAASLHMVFGYYGFHIPEHEIRELGDFNDENGLSREELVELAKEYDFWCNTKTKSTLDDLINTIEKKMPVIFDWNAPKLGPHFSVLYGYENNKLYIHDPYKIRNGMEYEKFLKFWNFDSPKRWLMICAPGPLLAKK